MWEVFVAKCLDFYFISDEGLKKVSPPSVGGFGGWERCLRAFPAGKDASYTSLPSLGKHGTGVSFPHPYGRKLPSLP